MVTLSRLVELGIEIWAEKGYPKGSPTRVLANKFFFFPKIFFRKISSISVFGPRPFPENGHPLQY